MVPNPSHNYIVMVPNPSHNYVFQADSADYIACSHFDYVNSLDMLRFAKPGASFVLNCASSSVPKKLWPK